MIVTMAPTILYFPILKHKHDECISYLKSQNIGFFIRNGVTYAELRWDTLRYLGTQTQLLFYNRMRRDYIYDLLIRHCHHTCTYEIIGSRNKSSDIDINLNTGLTSALNSTRALKHIHSEHHRKYKLSLQDMFDINIYLTTIPPDLHIPSSSTRQHAFAVTRYVVHMGIHSPYVSDQWRPLLKTANDLSKLRSERSYLPRVQSYISKYRAGAPAADIADAFSMSKLSEHESYYSIGACLHIVNHQLKTISVGQLVDSILDNLGFAAEFARKYNPCTSGATALVKVAKYLLRMMEASRELHKRLGKRFPAAITKLQTACTDARKPPMKTGAVDHLWHVMNKIVSKNTVQPLSIQSLSTAVDVIGWKHIVPAIDGLVKQP